MINKREKFLIIDLLNLSIPLILILIIVYIHLFNLQLYIDD
jgi:hypothetical protein